MAEGGGAAEQRGLLCLGCWTVVSKPMVLECGHALCLACLLKKPRAASCCSRCWEFSRLKSSGAAMALRPEGQGMCGLHREELKLFCERTKSLLCVSCSGAEEHEGHIHWATAVAALRYGQLLQAQLDSLQREERSLQELLLQEEQQALAWAVVWPEQHARRPKRSWKSWLRPRASVRVSRKEPADKRRLKVARRHRKLAQLFDRLKEMEASQQGSILKAKEEWRALMATQSSLLTHRMGQLKAILEKPGVELLAEVAQTLHWTPVEPVLEPFLLQVDASYLTVVLQFLQLFHTCHLGDKATRYDLSEEHQRAIHILPGFSGRTYMAYITGSVQAESTIRRRAFVLQPQAQPGMA